MVKRYILLGLCILILFCGALLYFYPVKEISGYFTGGDTLYFSVNSNGTADYYTNYYVQQLIDNGPDDCPHTDTRSIVVSKRLNIFEKITINKYAEQIVESGNTGKHQVGSDGLIYMCIKIDGVKYYSDPYQIYRFNEAEYGEFEHPDVIDLSTYMWFNKPKECDQYWNIDRNSYPYFAMDKDNYKGVLDYFRNYHNRMIEEWS
ncbi:MAG TPA: hypothetical protein H9685_07270 [Firmicutes bacterium]|nr:hypothetical protein [Bacillota bacterium]